MNKILVDVPAGTDIKELKNALKAAHQREFPGGPVEVDLDEIFSDSNEGVVESIGQLIKELKSIHTEMIKMQSDSVNAIIKNGEQNKPEMPDFSQLTKSLNSMSLRIETKLIELCSEVKNSQKETETVTYKVKRKIDSITNLPLIDEVQEVRGS